MKKIQILSTLIIFTMFIFSSFVISDDKYEDCNCSLNFRKYRDEIVSITPIMIEMKNKSFYLNPDTIILGDYTTRNVSGRKGVVFVSNDDDSALGIIIQ